ncbi:MAG: beta-N-acetylhexosaminidase [Ignavibacteriaceae bacterium]
MKYLKNFAALVVAIILLSVNLYAKDADKKLNLMPLPVKVELTGGEYRLDSNFTIVIKGNPAERLYPAASRMLRRLSGKTGLFFKQDYINRNSTTENPGMIISVERPGKVKLYEDESYKLVVTDAHVLLNAKTDIGALRGIETFLQLIDADSLGYYFPTVNIEDYPRFPWRGLMIDACRHFMPVDVIKRNLDGMAAVKMNVFHWHLSDDQGFRVECKTFPKLTGMGSDGLFYTQVQIKDIIKYANDRGIRVVPEFDLPGHSTSWFVGYSQYASAPGPYSIERKFGVFDPTFNPTIEKTYEFLDKFFEEMSKLFPDEYMHIGGDENNGKQWNTNPEIQAFMKKHKIPDNQSLQSYFNKRLLTILTKYHKKMVGWEEILHPGMPKNIVIQSWRGEKSLENAASKGYQVILSKGYYIDLNQPTDYHYLNDPVPDSLQLDDSQKKFIIGGEATMWSEFVSPENIDSRIWPRTAAIAERFWSPKNVRDVKDMYRRLDVISFELEDLGLTHIKNQEMMIRRLTNNNDVTALTNFMNVVEPVKEYNRSSQRNDYTSYSPLTRVVDAAVPDAEVARNFRDIVDNYLVGNLNDENSIKSIEQNLIIWRDNYAQLEKTIEKSPILKEIESLSKDLSGISLIGLQALEDIKNNKKANADWVQNSLEVIKNAKAPRGQIELMVISPIEKLIKRTSKI